MLERLSAHGQPARIEMRDGMSVRGWTERASQILTNIAGERFPIMLAFVALPRRRTRHGPCATAGTSPARTCPA